MLSDFTEWKSTRVLMSDRKQWSDRMNVPLASVKISEIQRKYVNFELSICAHETVTMTWRLRPSSPRKIHLPAPFPRQHQN